MRNSRWGRGQGRKQALPFWFIRFILSVLQIKYSNGEASQVFAKQFESADNDDQKLHKSSLGDLSLLGLIPQLTQTLILQGLQRRTLSREQNVPAKAAQEKGDWRKVRSCGEEAKYTTPHLAQTTQAVCAQHCAKEVKNEK